MLVTAPLRLRLPLPLACRPRPVPAPAPRGRAANPPRLAGVFQSEAAEAEAAQTRPLRRKSKLGTRPKSQRDDNAADTGAAGLRPQADGIPRGGLTRALDAGIPDLGLPCVEVEGPDAVVGLVKKRKGEELFEPTETETEVQSVGRHGVLAGSQDAVLGFVKPPRA